MTGHSDCTQTHEWVSLGYSIFLVSFFSWLSPWTSVRSQEFFNLLIEGVLECLGGKGILGKTESDVDLPVVTIRATNLFLTELVKSDTSVKVRLGSTLIGLPNYKNPSPLLACPNHKTGPQVPRSWVCTWVQTSFAPGVPDALDCSLCHYPMWCKDLGSSLFFKAQIIPETQLEQT